MRLSFLQSALALFGALTLVAGAPARLEGVRPLSGAHPENWWKENQGRHEATATWHAHHERGGPGKYSKEVLDKLKAARAEVGEPTGTNVEIPKAPVKPASAGGGSMPPGKGYKKRGEGEGPEEFRRASSAKAARGDDDGPQPAGDMPPGKQWRRHISDVESGDADGDDGRD